MTLSSGAIWVRAKHVNQDSKTPTDSYVETIQQVLPGDTNPLGTVFGGKVMQWIDTVAAISAMRHCRQTVVTASIDRIDFHAPAKVGHVMILQANVFFAGRTSMEVKVTVMAENPLSGRRELTTEARLTFVAIDSDGQPTAVPGIKPVSEDDKRLYAEAQARRSQRKK